MPWEEQDWKFISENPLIQRAPERTAFQKSVLGKAAGGCRANFPPPASPCQLITNIYLSQPAEEDID